MSAAQSLLSLRHGTVLSVSVPVSAGCLPFLHPNLLAAGRFGFCYPPSVSASAGCTGNREQSLVARRCGRIRPRRFLASAMIRRSLSTSHFGD